MVLSATEPWWKGQTYLQGLGGYFSDNQEFNRNVLLFGPNYMLCANAFKDTAAKWFFLMNSWDRNRERVLSSTLSHHSKLPLVCLFPDERLVLQTEDWNSYMEVILTGNIISGESVKDPSRSPPRPKLYSTLFWKWNKMEVTKGYIPKLLSKRGGALCHLCL